jgi:hypothetical protein
MQIDLGDVPKASVKLGADSYEVSLPTVKQAQIFRAKMEEDGVDELDAFSEFMGDLGFPKEVCEKLTVHQLTRLAEGLMGDPGKK